MSQTDNWGIGFEDGRPQPARGDSFRDLVGLFVKSGLELFNLVTNATRPDQLRDSQFVSTFFAARREGAISVDSAWVLYSATQHLVRHGVPGAFLTVNAASSVSTAISRTLFQEHAGDRPLVTGRSTRETPEVGAAALAYLRVGFPEDLDSLAHDLLPRISGGGVLMVETAGLRYPGELQRDLNAAVPSLFWHRIGPHSALAVR